VGGGEKGEGDTHNRNYGQLNRPRGNTPPFSERDAYE